MQLAVLATNLFALASPARADVALDPSAGVSAPVAWSGQPLPDGVRASSVDVRVELEPLVAHTAARWSLRATSPGTVAIALPADTDDVRLVDLTDVHATVDGAPADVRLDRALRCRTDGRRVTKMDDCGEYLGYGAPASEDDWFRVDVPVPTDRDVVLTLTYDQVLPGSWQDDVGYLGIALPSGPLPRATVEVALRGVPDTFVHGEPPPTADGGVLRWTFTDATARGVLLEVSPLALGPTALTEAVDQLHADLDDPDRRDRAATVLRALEVAVAGDCRTDCGDEIDDTLAWLDAPEGQAPARAPEAYGWSLASVQALVDAGTAAMSERRMKRTAAGVSVAGVLLLGGLGRMASRRKR